MIFDLINLARALLLIPIGFAGAFTAFPVFDAQMRTEFLRDGMTLVALAAAYVYLIAGVVWLCRMGAKRTFLGLSRVGCLVTIASTYLIGAGIVIALTLI